MLIPFQINSKIHLKRFVSANFFKFHNQLMIKFCIIVPSISVISCDLRIEIEIESTFEVARNICIIRTLYEREEL